ncbi:MipA/OmpV family protein [Rheinheimera sp. F8]|uniref:MipA/OmpV family protein n=1 Tax=Rheinheimera sp. F8 TaxID=1763998 RepID=UPI000744B3FA|nr:MipA/OmpV family protein [Rheinheimera sp. F8]ALZ74632.1 hypothetical protein ATY27_01910 [Rheinheimera sp. F8]
MRCVSLQHRHQLSGLDWLRLIAVLGFFLCSPAVMSDQTKVAAETAQLRTETGHWQFAVAVGYGELENPLARQKNPSSVLLPSWHYYGDKFYLDNFNLGYSLLETRDLEIDLQTRLNEDGLLFELNGLSRLFATDLFNRVPFRNERTPPVYENIQRHVSYLGGVQLNFPTAAATVSVGHFHDISNIHDGAETILRVNRVFSFDTARLGVEAGWTRKNQALVDYYYKLSSAELGYLTARQYTRATQNYHVRLVLNVPINPDWYWLLTAEHNWLGQGIRRSFLVNKAQYSAGFVGIGYDF